jgi:hypothetical protein
MPKRQKQNKSYTKPIGEHKTTPDTKTEANRDAHRKEPDVPLTSGIPAAPPPKAHHEVTCRPEKDFWDKIKTKVELFGILLLAVYTIYTIKMFYANRDAADAAKSAASIADATLKATQRAFRIEQRPYVVTEGPQFVQPPVAGKPTRVTVFYSNIGKTPAVKNVNDADLLKYHPGYSTETFVKFLEGAFTDLRHRANTDGGKFAALARSDIAPNARRFFSMEYKAPLSEKDVGQIQKGEGTVFVAIAILRYTDSFSETYETEMCEMFWGTDLKTWHFCDAHNTIK